jgi:hypothetical protein
MPIQNNIAPNNSIIRIIPRVKKNNSIEIPKNQEEKNNENSNEEIDF